MKTPQTIPILAFSTVREWRKWLSENHASSSGLWVKFSKKAAVVATITYDEALSEALCFGWIDGQLKTHDEGYYVRKFTPRGPKSVWSKRNVEKAEGLIGAGKMTEAGHAQIEKAKKDGRWEQAYDSPKNSTVPPDLRAALDANPKAQAAFDTLTRANSYAFIWRIQTARTPEKRKARIEQCIEMLVRGEVFHPPAGSSK